MTVAEMLDRMGAAEFDLWARWYTRHGFDADRIEATTANAGAYAGAVWGGKAKPGELVARFGPRDPRAEFERIKSYLSRAAAKQRKPKEPGGSG
jgi:hypothetical protein